MKCEIARFISLAPLSFVDFRVQPSPVVTASDASEFGGGVTMSTGLTESGSVAAGCSIRGDVLEPIEVTSVLAVGLFDGIAALRVAMDVLGWNVLGHVSVERDPGARRVVEAHCPSSVFVEDVTSVDQAMVVEWAGKFSQASLVVLGGGPPCQGVSKVERQSAWCFKGRKDISFSAHASGKGFASAMFSMGKSGAFDGKRQ